MTLTLYCVEDNEETTDWHPFAPDPYPRDAFEQLHTFITEPTNDIRNFEGGEEASRTTEPSIPPSQCDREHSPRGLCQPSLGALLYQRNSPTDQGGKRK